jgi:hypothetical protein
MILRLNSLTLSLQRGEARINFADVSYFWGQMGAGKTSILRLVDYCLGGSIQLTPALQGEFVTAKLSLSLANDDLEIERPRDSDRIIARWGDGDNGHELSLPARKADGEVLPGTGVEQLSDLLFWLSNVKAPRVRKSKLREDSETARLSIRDLLWYCYLDQDDIDSSFFHLDENAPFYLRHKSRDVLRYVVGYHDEHVADLEAELDQLRGERQALSASMDGLINVLKEVGVESELQILERIDKMRIRVAELNAEIENGRAAVVEDRRSTHPAEDLRRKARALDDKLRQTDQAILDILQAQDRDTRHRNEIETLSLKFRRSMSAKAVLTGVVFESCPRCAQALPKREIACCAVCGQVDRVEGPDPVELALIEKDAKARISELTNILSKHSASLAGLRSARDSLASVKARIERERNDVMSRYDSAYLSSMLTAERERAALLQEAENVESLIRLPQMVKLQRAKLENIVGREQSLRAELKETRQSAESDATNLDDLKSFFLDCLVRSGVPGIKPDDRVEIPLPSFYPEVYGSDPNDHAVTTFATLSSGGKKTLFKCCFAIAVHRLAVKLQAPLPALLIIDSPMKNISERENRDQFEGFYRMIYELKAGELKEIQFVLIDKEFSPPPADVDFNLLERHMRPGDKEHPPLIPYYNGK